jgi:hypothetical protein
VRVQPRVVLADDAVFPSRCPSCHGASTHAVKLHCWAAGEAEPSLRWL